MSAAIKICDRIIVDEEVIIRGMCMRTWVEVIKNDLGMLNLEEEMDISRTEWKKRIHIVDPKINFEIQVLLLLLLLQHILLPHWCSSGPFIFCFWDMHFAYYVQT